MKVHEVKKDIAPYGELSVGSGNRGNCCYKGGCGAGPRKNYKLDKPNLAVGQSFRIVISVSL